MCTYMYLCIHVCVYACVCIYIYIKCTWVKTERKEHAALRVSSKGSDTV